MNLENYKDPKTTQTDITDLHKLLVQTCIDFIRERELYDIFEVNFNVDGLENNAIEYGEWTPGMDSYCGVVGLQEDDTKTFTSSKGNEYTMRVRKLIGESF
jgi:hypothetical protein